MGMRESILSIPGPVPVPCGLYGTYYVRVMDGQERAVWGELAYPDGKHNNDNFMARLLVYCLCDEQGQRLFKDDEVEVLGKGLGPAIDKCFWEARKINLVYGAEESVKKA